MKSNRRNHHSNLMSVSLTDPTLPLAKQLEQALLTIKDVARCVDDYKGRLGDAKKLSEELQKKLRESETAAVAKDRIINDLRMQG